MAAAHDDEQKEVASLLKSLLTAFGGELPIQEIDKEYKTLVGSSIPYRKFRHATLASYLQSIPDVLNLKNRGGQLFACVVSDKNIELILRQVQEQDNSKYQKVSRKKKFVEFPRHLHVTSTAPSPSALWQRNTKNDSLDWEENEDCENLPRDPLPPPGFRSDVSPILQHMAPLMPTPMSGMAPQRRGPRFVFPHGLFPRHMLARDPMTRPVFCSDLEKKKKHEQDVNTRTREIANKFPAQKTYKQQLLDALKESGSGNVMPDYQTVQCGKKQKGWCSVVTINKKKVTGYPDIKSSREEAEEAVAQKALQQLTEVVKKLQAVKLPTTTDYDVSVTRVKQLLKERAHCKRFWWDALSELYCEVYNEKLPEDWISKLKARNDLGLTFDNPCVDRWTIELSEKVNRRSPTPDQETPVATPPHQKPTATTPPDQNATTPTTPDQNATTTTPPDQKPATTTSCSARPKSNDGNSYQTIGMKLPPITLPSTPTWGVSITCLHGPKNIQLRLVGEEYSNKFSDLLTEMELHYMEEKNQHPVKEPQVGDIYVVNSDDSWYRVVILQVMGDTARVRFVDHGDSEDISLSDIYFLQKRFFSLPAQALHCTLSGLENLPTESAFKAMVENLPMGKALVAHVQRPEEPYTLVIYDTTTSEDININEKILQAVTQNLVEPSLPSVGGFAEVYITHASTEGVIYVQIESQTYKILEDLLHLARSRTEEMLGETVPIDLGKLYLARFGKDGEWYRGAPRSTVDDDGKVLVKFVDFGNCEKVPHSSIKNIESVCPLLANIPVQCLPCRLHNVPVSRKLQWTIQTCERLLELAPLDTPLLLKVIEEAGYGQPPTVQLFKRLQPQNELVSINDTLGVDANLFRSEGDSNNNREKDVVVSQFRSQESSCASGSDTLSPAPKPQPAGAITFPPCPSLSLGDIPDVNQYFDVFVTFAANPHHFAVQPWMMTSEFDSLLGKFQDYYRNPAKWRTVTSIKSGQYCALKHSDDFWYRARVEMVEGDNVAGIFVDYGDRFISTVENVQPLTSEFCSFPCLAIKAKLFGIEPVHIDWSPEDACRFRELAGNKSLVSTVCNKEVLGDGCLFLSLMLVDTSDSTMDCFINQVLVDEGRAVCVSL